jgi:hypothetical protein
MAGMTEHVAIKARIWEGQSNGMLTDEVKSEGDYACEALAELERPAAGPADRP